MAETASGPEPSTAVGNSPAESPLRTRLPQAQAENILASLAGRSGASPGLLHNGYLASRPPGASRPGPGHAVPMDHRTSGQEPEPEPGPAGAQPHLGAGTSKSPGPSGPAARPGPVAPAAAAAAGESGGTKGRGPGVGHRRASRPANASRPAAAYNNDILPAKPSNRLRFLFFLPFGGRR